MTAEEAEKPLDGLEVLLIEDLASLRMVYRSILMHAGAEVRVAATAEDGRAAFRARPVPVVLLDLALPDGDGLEVLHDLRSMRADLRVVVITAHGGVDRAVAAMRAGAHDFLTKPFDEERLITATRGAARSLASPGRRPRAISEGLGAMVGSSRVMSNVARALAAAAPAMAPVLVTGSAGAGKELCARMLHALSGRAAGPFLPIDCAETAPEDIRQLLFAENGVFAAPEESTLYLANIPALPLALQQQLLPFLHHGGHGAVDPQHPFPGGHPGRVRVVAGISGTADPALSMGRLDPALFRLLDTLRIDLPPLRERGRDAAEIARAALAHFGAELGKSFTGLSEPVAEALCLLPWSGNVQELLDVIREIALSVDGGEITLDMLPAALMRPGANNNGLAAVPEASELTTAELAARRAAGIAPPPANVVPLAIPREVALRALRGLTFADIERAVIEDAIAAAGGSLPSAARMLGLAPSTLYRKRQSWAASGE